MSRPDLCRAQLSNPTADSARRGIRSFPDRRHPNEATQLPGLWGFVECRRLRARGPPNEKESCVKFGERQSEFVVHAAEACRKQRDVEIIERRLVIRALALASSVGH